MASVHTSPDTPHVQAEGLTNGPARTALPADRITQGSTLQQTDGNRRNQRKPGRQDVENRGRARLADGGTSLQSTPCHRLLAAASRTDTHVEISRVIVAEDWRFLSCLALETFGYQ